MCSHQTYFYVNLFYRQKTFWHASFIWLRFGEYLVKYQQFKILGILVLSFQVSLVIEDMTSNTNLYILMEPC